MIAPVIGGRRMPRQYRIALTFLITLAVMPFIEEVPQVDPFSADSILIAIHQIIIGFAMGFAILMVIHAVILAGEAIAMTMGLGFAIMSDPVNGGQSAVVSQFYMVLASLLFLSFNGHLALIEMMAESFLVLPLSTQGLSPEGIWILLSSASNLFLGALAIALPTIAALLSVNLIMGIITRASPQLNIFSIGFPITMMVGFVFMNLSMPGFLAVFEHLLADGFAVARAIFGGTF